MHKFDIRIKYVGATNLVNYTVPGFAVNNDRFLDLKIKIKIQDNIF